MSEDNIRMISADEITQALEDARDRYARPEESQTEKSRKAVLEEIRSMLVKHPEMSNKEIALEVGATPKQVGAQRYLVNQKSKALQGAKTEAVEAAASEKPQEAAEGKIKPAKAEADKETGETIKAETEALTPAESAIVCEVPGRLIDDAATALIKVVKTIGGRPVSCDAFVCADSVRLSVLLG